MDSSALCPADAVFIGFDPACEPQSKCCRPVDAGAPKPPAKVVDAGPPPSSSGRNCLVGICRTECLRDETAYDGHINGSCLINEVCCKQ